MEILSAEVYSKIWLVFPIGLWVYMLLMAIIKKYLSKRVAYIFSFFTSLTVLIFLWSVIGFGVVTYVFVGLYVAGGLFIAFSDIKGRSRFSSSSHHSGGGGSGSFGGGSSGGGGASGNW